MRNVLHKLKEAPQGSFHILDPLKAKRMNAATLYIPSVQDVRDAIRAIPQGETRSIIQLRQTLAEQHHAETACPACTIKYWKWLAEAFETTQDESHQIPWWRVLKDGQPSRHMPGGTARQIALLAQEGIKLTSTNQSHPGPKPQAPR